MKRNTVVSVLLFISVVALGYTYYLCKLDLEASKAQVKSLRIEKAKEELAAKKKKRRAPDVDTSFLAKIRRNGRVTLPSVPEIEVMSPEAVMDSLHSYLGNIEIVCPRMLRMGNLMDGGWEVCDVEEYRPISPCLVYSFGIQNDFSFDDYTASNYGCKVFSFDPSMTQESYQRSALVQFLKQGVASRDVKPVKSDDWEMYTITSFKKMLGHNERPLDVLKMDIEGTEWDVLDQLVESGEARRIRQLLVEFHLWFNNDAKMLTNLKVLKKLYDLGFRKFYSHENPGCHFESSQTLPVQRTDCYEVYYVNTNMES